MNLKPSCRGFRHPGATCRDTATIAHVRFPRRPLRCASRPSASACAAVTHAHQNHEYVPPWMQPPDRRGRKHAIRDSCPSSSDASPSCPFVNPPQLLVIGRAKRGSRVYRPWSDLPSLLPARHLVTRMSSADRFQAGPPSAPARPSARRRRRRSPVTGRTVRRIGASGMLPGTGREIRPRVSTSCA